MSACSAGPVRSPWQRSPWSFSVPFHFAVEEPGNDLSQAGVEAEWIGIGVNGLSLFKGTGSHVAPDKWCARGDRPAA